MKKSRTKFLSIFAILFVAIFAVSCCFFAACKGNSDDGGNSGDTGTQQGDDTGSGSGDGSGSGSDSGDSGSGSGTEDGSGSGAGQTVTQVVYLATSSDEQYTKATTEVGDAVFTNESDLEIDMSSDGLTYTVSGTASVMGEAEAAWYATDDVEEGTPYVVIKIAVAEGGTIYFENSGKTYTNDEDGAADFDVGYIFIVCKLSFEGDNCVTVAKYDITPVEGETVTYTVSFSGVKYPAEETPIEYTQSRVYDFDDPDTYENFMKPAGDGKLVSGNYVSGIVTFVTKSDGTSSIEAKEFDDDTTRGAWVPNGKSGSACYVGIDLNDYIGEYVKIEVEFAANVAAESGRSLYVGTSNVDASNSSNASKLIAETQTTSYAVTDVKTLVFETEITSTYKALYLDSDASLCFYKITVSLTGNVNPWVNEGTSSDDEESKVIFAYDFSSSALSDETKAQIPQGTTVEFDAGGILKFVSSTSSTYNSDGGGRIRTGSATTLSDGSGAEYFVIDLTSYSDATSVTIEVKFGGQATASTDEGADNNCYLYFTDSLMAASSVTEENRLAVLSYLTKNTTTDSVTINLENVTESTIYILCNMKTDFYSINITVNGVTEA